MPRKRLPQLLRGPFRGGVSGHGEMQYPAAVVSQHQEYVQHLKPNGWHREEVDRYHILDVILQERPPGLRRWLAASAIYLPTLVSPMSMASLRSSPWMRGAPQSGFSRLILRISCRICLDTAGRPG